MLTKIGANTIKKYFIIIVILIFPLFSSELKIKIKAHQSKDLIRTKILIHNPMTNNDYITNIKASIGEKLLYDLSLTPLLPSNPVFNFKFKSSLIGEDLSVIVTDNNNQQKTKSISIRSQTNNKQMSFLSSGKNIIKKVDPKVWRAKTVKEAITLLYGPSELIEGDITLEVEDIVYRNRFPINIKSNLDLESIIVFLDGKERTVIAILNTSVEEVRKFSMDLRTQQTGKSLATITVVGKERNGKLYFVKRDVKNCLADCDGGGG